MVADELRDACRFCGQAIRYVRWLDEATAPPEVPREERTRWNEGQELLPILFSYRRLHWEHVETYLMRCHPEDEADKRQARPANYCDESKTTGEKCLRKAQDEFRPEGIIACGTHARMVRKDLERERMNKEYAVKRQEEEEMAALEADAYLQAAEALRAMPGMEVLFPALKTYVPKGLYSYRVTKEIEVNVVNLWKFVNGVVEEEQEDTDEYQDWELSDEEA